MTFKSSLLNTCNRFKEAIVLTAIIFLLFLLQIILFSIFAVSIDLDGEIDAIAIIIIIALVKFGMSVNNYILDFSFLLIMVVMFSFVFCFISIYGPLVNFIVVYIWMVSASSNIFTVSFSNYLSRVFNRDYDMDKKT